MSLLGSLLSRSWRLVAVAAVAGAIAGFSSAGVIGVLHAAIGGGQPALLWAFLALAVTSVLGKAVSEILLTRLGQATIARLRLELGRRVVDAPLRQIEELGAHRVLAALNDDAAVISQAYVQLPLVCVNLATVVGCLVYLGWVSWLALVAVLAVMAVGTLVFRLQEGPALRLFARARETSDALFHHFRALTGGIKELKLHRARGEAFLSDHLGRTVTAQQRDVVAGMTRYSVAMGWGGLLFYAALGLTVFALPAWSGLTAADAMAAMLALLYLMGPFAHLVEILPAIGRASVAIATWQRLAAALQAEPAAQRALPPGNAAAPRIDAGWQRLDLVGVTHRYQREHEAGTFQLGPIDLTFRPGEIVFLVGGNGSGKTTLGLVLLGLYAPEAGEIRVDGVPIDDASRASYRQLFSAVFADFHLFDGLVGLTGPDLEDRARSYLAELRLERQVKLDAGALRVNGLSQGQRKRLALLTAFLEDRPFYVFDEWASDQDPQFRRVFYTELLPELRARGKTALVITHDDQYFATADRCLHMDFGTLTQRPAPHAAVASHAPARITS